MAFAVTFRPRVAAVILALQLMFLPQLLLAEDTISSETLQQQLSTVESDTALTEQTRSELIAQLQAGLEQLQREANQRTRAAELQNAIDSTPQQVQHFEQKLLDAQRNPPDLDALGDPGVGTEALEGNITLLQAEQQALTERRSQLLAEIDALPARRTTIQNRLVEIQSQAALNSNAMVAPTDTLDQSTAQMLAQARNQALQAEQRSLEVEVLSESSRAQASVAERAWINFALDATGLKLQALTSALEQAQAAATEQQLATTTALEEKLQVEGGGPALQAFADQNRQLAEQVQETAQQTDIARAEGREIELLLADLEQDSHLMRRRLAVAGRKEVLGRVMITRLNSLPNTALIKRDIDQRNQLIANTSLIQIDSEEESRALSERQKYFHTPDFSGLDASAQELVGRLVAQRSQLLEENIRDLGNLLRLLLDNNDAASALIATTEEFHQFLLGNLMWVRDFSFVEPAGLFRQVGALLSPADWLALPAHAIEGMQAHSLAGGLLLLLISLLMRWQLRGSYETLMSTPTPLSSESLWNILLGMGLSVVLALHWPLALWLLGYFLEETPSKTAFTDALSAALLFTARILYLLLLTRLLTHRMGVGHRFLKWNAHMLDSVRNELNWAGPVTVLAILVSVFAYHHNIIASGGGLSAIANTTLASTVIVACIRLLRQDIFTDDVLLKTALRMFAALGAMVIIMQLMGLLFAAEIYLMALGRSVTVLLVVKTVGDILERWLLILRASLKRKARDELKAQLEEGEDVTEEGNNQLDVVFLSEAHAKLLGLARLVTIALALWLIWSPSLPALNLLDSTTLWHVTDSANPGAGLRAITLFDFSLGVLVLVVTGLLTRHLPSVSEVFMREWFNMSSGSRYASTILMQYMVIAVGGSLFLTIVGWEWSKVQWLVAALGVGIGFGLQEIVANFISGIIILFERPVRVGDIISAGGAEGVVRKINPRATIIETFDRKEHLIPNKELITGQVINWSLSENEVRVVIPVGIAYGSDVRLAMDLLLQAAHEVEQVLAEPEPTATFEDFGDNSLLLWLRCYVAENRPKAWTELRTCINDKFTEAGIAMAFPQRDVHLDMASPLRVEVSNPTRGKD